MSLSFDTDFYSSFYYPIIDDSWYDGWYDFDYILECEDGGDGSTCPDGGADGSGLDCWDAYARVELISYDHPWWIEHYDDVI